MPRQEKVVKKYMFTMFDVWDGLTSLNALRLLCSYMIFGIEYTTAGLVHYQGFICLINGMRTTALQKVCKMSYMYANGTIASNKRYCSKGKQSHDEYTELGVAGPNYGKDANVFEFGEDTERHLVGGMKEKARWATALANAKAGNFDEIDADIYMRQYSTIKRIHMDHSKPNPTLDDTTGVWIWGPSGSGKSRLVRERYAEYFLKAANKWWDGYQGQEVVYLEDFGLEHHVLGHHLKLWADRYDFVAEIKGGSLRARPKRFVITSQYRIQDIWPNNPETVSALERRFVVEHIPLPIASQD